MKSQRTINKEVSYEGAGLFNGIKVKVTFRPAPVDSGIVFIRTDTPEFTRVPVAINTISPGFHRTAFSSNGVSVETVEHLLAAISGLSIDNLEIAINGAEIPHADGSAKPFVELLIQAGLKEQDTPKKIFQPRSPISYTEGDVSLIALPSTEGLVIDYTLQYAAPLIGTQHYTLKITEEAFKTEIAPARTFCLADEADNFVKQGLGKGASYQNAVVVDKEKVVQNTLRFKDEFVRHKILDLLGDLTTLSTSLEARIIAIKSGHSQNIKFAQKIAEAMKSDQMPSTKSTVLMETREIQNILPHRYPFLLLDKVIEMKGYERAVGIKNVTFNEPFFQGHFPGRPLMPGVLQVEAMAQLTGALLLSRAGNENKLAVFLSIDEARFRKPVVPGDQLRIEVETIKTKARVTQVQGKITVDGELVAEAQLKCMLVDKE